MHSLPIFLDLHGRPVILIGGGEAAAAKRRLLERAGATIVGEEGEARIAIVAIEDDAEAGAAVARLRARGIMINATDRPALCDFTLPAIVDRDPVLIAIGTGGASAGLAKELRQRIETMLPARLGELAAALHAARDRIRARWTTPETRRRAIDAGLGQGGAIDPAAPDAADHVETWLAAEDKAAPDAFVAIALRSANPDDLTLGEARLLGRADTLYHRPAVPPAILDRARADALRVSCPAPPVAARAGLSIDLDI